MRIFYKPILTAAILLAAFSFLNAQQAKNISAPKTPLSAAMASSPAYAEILLRRTEQESELESLLVDYTEEYPRIKELRHSLSIIKKESDRLNSVKATDAGKLTLALGRMVVRKIELETDLWKLLQNYADGHPDVKRAKRKVEIYEKAIQEILG